MYYLQLAHNNDNPNLYGYVFSKDNEVLEQVVFDKESMAYSDIIKEKTNFLSVILEKYPEVNWKRLLITLVARDNDLIDFYKEIFFKDKIINPQTRTESFDEKITPDEKLYLDVCLKELRQKLED